MEAGKSGPPYTRGLVNGGKFQLFGHSAEFSGRVGMHFMHDLAAMDLRGDFAGSESRRNLLCEHAGDQESQHLALTRSQGLITFLQLSYLALLFSRFAFAQQRLLNSIQQILVPKWFRQKL